jgi:ACS family D-galactonate transporter-like MFS transporter
MRPAKPRHSHRLVSVAVLLGLSAFLNYVDRGSLSIAGPILKDELAISPARLGMLLSAFFWTYACSQLLAGWMVDRLNVNWVLTGGFIVWSAATACTGIAHSFALLFALRLLLGLGESVAFPSYSKIIACSFPERNRGFANSAVSAGQVLGPGLGILSGGMLMARYGWRPLFVVLGVASLLWVVPWALSIPARLPSHFEHRGTAPRMRELLHLRSLWGSCLGLFCCNYVNYFLVAWLPYFLVRDRHFTMQEMATLGGVAYIAAACCALLAGRLSDRWVGAGASPSLVRKTITAGGLALSGVSLSFATVGKTPACATALILGVIFFAVSASNVWAITQTLAGPAAAGRWTGFQNFAGNTAGIVAPTLTGWILSRTGEFDWAFLVTVGVALIGMASWIFLVGRVEPVIWGRGRLTASRCAGRSVQSPD